VGGGKVGLSRSPLVSVGRRRLSFIAAIDEHLLYTTPSHLVCILNGDRHYLGFQACDDGGPLLALLHRVGRLHFEGIDLSGATQDGFSPVSATNGATGGLLERSSAKYGQIGQRPHAEPPPIIRPSSKRKLISRAHPSYPQISLPTASGCGTVVMEASSVSRRSSFSRLPYLLNQFAELLLEASRSPRGLLGERIKLPIRRVRLGEDSRRFAHREAEDVF
jgi:hypothetical protein